MQVVKWIEALNKDIGFVWGQKALDSIPVVNGDGSLPAALMQVYLQRKIPICERWQTRFVQIMKVMLERGHSCNALLQRKPVWFYILQLRFVELYPFLRLPNQPTASISVQLAGFFGALVKAALNVQVNGAAVSTVIEQRQAHFDFRSILVHMAASSTQQVSIPELMTIINQQAVPPLREVDCLQSYPVSIHPKLPKLGRFLIHEACLNGQTTLLHTLVQRYPKAMSLRDNWARTPLHVLAIMHLESEQLSTIVSDTVLGLKDGFGRTASAIQQWKKQIVHSSSLESDNSKDNGGWRTEYLDKYRTTKQEVDVVEYASLSWQKFQELYASCGKPVLIRGVPGVEALQQRWRCERFEAVHRDLPVEVGDVPYARSLGRAGGMKSFAEYRRTKGEYAFVQLHPKVHETLLREIPSLGYFSNLVGVYTQFYQGVAGTGAPMHLHIDAWNCLVHGEKRWFLSPPFQGAYSSMPVKDWVDNIMPDMNVIEVTQKAGEILYVPKYWSHAVLNTQECIGIAREFINPYLA